VKNGFRRLNPIQDEYVSKMNEAGLNGQEILDMVEQLAQKYDAEYK